MSDAISSRDSRVPPGLSGNMARLRATRMRVDTILLWAAALSSTVMRAGSMRSEAVPWSCEPTDMEKPLW